MRTSEIIRKIILSLFAFLLLISPRGMQAAEKGYREKTVQKIFNVSASDLFRAENRYGSITVDYWNKNQVEVIVVIEGRAESDAKAQELIDRVNIAFSSERGVVSATTLIENTKAWGNNSHFAINYRVMLPWSLSAELNQKYGNILLPKENRGRYKLEAKYGNIEGGSFSKPLFVKTAYGNVTLDNVDKLTLDGAYSPDIDIRSVGTGVLECKYSSTTIGSAEKLEVDDRYGNVTVDKMAQGRFVMKYGNLTVDALSEKLEADDFNYSNLKIKNIAPGFDGVSVVSRYSNLTLSIPESAAFKVKAENLKYGESKIDRAFRVTNEVKENGNYLRAAVNGGGKGNIYFDGGNYSKMKIKAL